MADQALDKSTFNKASIGVGIAAIAAAGAWFYWHSHHEPQPTASVPAGASPGVPAAAAEPRIEHPLPAQGEAGSPQPDLTDSDKPVSDALAQALPGTPLADFLVPESIIRNIVVTVDNLPRQKVALNKRPIVPTTGAFLVAGDELHATLDSRNFQRYAPLIEMLRKADMQRLAGVYRHFYPLFQKAYQDLGYPAGYFNDRLVKVIDLVLATPQIAGPVDLVRPNVMYAFADPALESLPAGQKLLIRMGPDNAAAVKAKLMELRAVITAGAARH